MPQVEHVPAETWIDPDGTTYRVLWANNSDRCLVRYPDNWDRCRDRLWLLNNGFKRC